MTTLPRPPSQVKKEYRRGGKTSFRRRQIGKVLEPDGPIRWVGTLRYYNCNVPLTLEQEGFKPNPALGPSVWSRFL